MISITIYCQECEKDFSVEVDVEDFNYLDDIVKECGWTAVEEDGKSYYWCPKCGG